MLLEHRRKGVVYGGVGAEGYCLGAEAWWGSWEEGGCGLT